MPNNHPTLGRRLRGLFFILLPLVFFSACSSEDADMDRNGDATQSQSILQAGQSVAVPERLREAEQAWQVELDQQAFADIVQPGQVDRFIGLPDGRQLDFQVQDVEGTPPRVLRGQLIINGEPLSGLTLSLRSDRMTGGFRTESERFRLQSAADGGLLLVKLKMTEPPPPSQPIVPDD